MNAPNAIGAQSEKIELDGPKVYHIPSWEEFGDPKRMDIITNIAKMRGRDPRIATLAVKILKNAGVEPRDYVGQSQALLQYVQNDLYYVNEPGERLSDPLRTLDVGYGDCDDLVITLGALLESIRLPWRVVISGNDKRGRKVRYHHGDKFPGGGKKGYTWSHIYMMIGDRPFTPQKWRYAETTVKGAPLGWDVVDGDASIFPELKSNYGAAMYGKSMQLYTPTNQYKTLTAPVANLNTTLVQQAPAASIVTKGVDPGGQRRARNGVAGPQEADAVAIVVIGPSGKVLGMQRSSEVSWMASRWDLPGGPTNGRPALQAAVELLAAETGIVTQPRYLRKCSLAYHPDAGTSAFYVYKLPKKQEIMFRAMEHQGYKFIPREDLIKSFRTAPYVEVALRACFAPSSLATSPALKGKSAAQLAKIVKKKQAAALAAQVNVAKAQANGNTAAETAAVKAKMKAEAEAKEAQFAAKYKADQEARYLAQKAREVAYAEAMEAGKAEAMAAFDTAQEYANAQVSTGRWDAAAGRDYLTKAKHQAHERLAQYQNDLKHKHYGAFDMEEMKLQLAKEYVGVPLWLLLAGAGGAYYYYNHMR